MKVVIEQTSMGFRVRLSGELFNQALDEFKAWIPASCRHFNKESRLWFVELRSKRALQVWASWVKDELSGTVEWSDERGYYARQQEARQTERERCVYADYEVPQPTPRAAVDPVEALYAVLYLRPGAPIKLVEAAKKILLVEHHPDKGGDNDQAVRINTAVDLIKELEARRSDAA